MHENVIQNITNNSANGYKNLDSNHFGLAGDGGAYSLT